MIWRGPVDPHRVLMLLACARVERAWTLLLRSESPYEPLAWRLRCYSRERVGLRFSDDAVSDLIADWLQPEESPPVVSVATAVNADSWVFDGVHQRYGIALVAFRR